MKETQVDALLVEKRVAEAKLELREQLTEQLSGFDRLNRCKNCFKEKDGGVQYDADTRTVRMVEVCKGGELQIVAKGKKSPLLAVSKDQACQCDEPALKQYSNQVSTVTLHAHPSPSPHIQIDVLNKPETLDGKFSPLKKKSSTFSALHDSI